VAEPEARSYAAGVLTIVSPDGSCSLDADPVDGGGSLWLGGEDVAAATGWQLKPEGLCRDDVCVVLRDDVRDGDRVDAAAVWRRLGKPVLTSAAGDAWYLGEGAEVRAGATAGGLAPDFRLEDLAGVEHALSDLRGRKVLLVSWAPW
jgi:hypothetical protein